MKAKLFLRIASGLMIFHLLGHSFGHFTWKQTPDSTKQEVVNQMTEHKFPFMGSVRSMSDYYDGYGWACSIAMIFFAIILWLISGAVEEHTGLVYKIIIATTLCLFAWSIDEFIFFFPFAACNTLLAGIFAFVSAVQLRKQQS